MATLSEWHSFADFFEAGEFKVPGKPVSRVLEKGRTIWRKTELGYPRELTLHTMLHDVSHLRVQQSIRFDRIHSILETEDAGRDLWDWLWVSAKSPGDESHPMLVTRKDLRDHWRQGGARYHILNWDDTLLRFAAGALEVLDGVHALGIVHFDLHLANWCLPAINPKRIDNGQGPFKLQFELRIDQPYLIDFSESLWEDRLPLNCIPRHVRALLDQSTWEFTKTRSRLSPQFRHVAQAAREHAMRLDQQFAEASRQDQWKMLVDRKWCESHGLKDAIHDLLVRQLDWREDLYQLGYMLDMLKGELRNDVIHGHTLGWRGGPARGDTRDRALASLPAEAALVPQDRRLRAHLERLIAELMALTNEPSAPRPAQRPHLGLADAIRQVLKVNGLDSHEQIRFVLEFDAPAARPSAGRFNPGGEAWSPAMVTVPEGTYRVGPPHDMRTVTLVQPLAVSQDPITVQQFAAFAAALPRCPDAWRLGLERARKPMTNITRAEAERYADWLTQRLGESEGLAPYRLMSADEWEVCCRARALKSYGIGPQGADDISRRDAIYRWSERNKADVRWGFSSNLLDVLPVDDAKNATNGFGLRGMHGNVWEFTAGKSRGSTIGLRGGSYTSAPRELMAWWTREVDVRYFANDVGFRVCRNLPRTAPPRS